MRLLPIAIARNSKRSASISTCFAISGHPPQPRRNAADATHRMDFAHIGNDGRAKGGGAQLGEPDRGDQAAQRLGFADRLGDLLRHSPLWRLADFPARDGRRLLARCCRTPEPVGQFLSRLREHGATHITGTPSHWRRVLWSPTAFSISPRYARMSGEVADQAIIDNLHTTYPEARIGHAYASTEAGVGSTSTTNAKGFRELPRNAA